ncbi:hypothetical protein SORBI_3002G418800 [Sorghum bicolor]|uniref:Uncharacterized protein n=1 Tax=Sorghum bicolor TaxID=4558 RepID=A0A1B6QGC6_SORBI|nr:hypothetical protein SORBI_3002G418800 [Sorghum bicolor]
MRARLPPPGSRPRARLPRPGPEHSLMLACRMGCALASRIATEHRDKNWMGGVEMEGVVAWRRKLSGSGARYISPSPMPRNCLVVGPTHA